MEQEVKKYQDANWNWQQKLKQRFVIKDSKNPKKRITLDAISYIRHLTKVMLPFMDVNTGKPVSHYDNIVALYRQKGAAGIDEYVQLINELTQKTYDDAEKAAASSQAEIDKQEKEEMSGTCKRCGKLTGPLYDSGCDEDKNEDCAWHIKQDG